MSDKQTIEVYNQQIEKYKQVAASDEYRLAEFENVLTPNSFVLDLGCGPADASAYLKSKGHRVDPVDASIEMVNAANELYDIGARQALFSDIEGSEIYEGAWANFSLLHASVQDMPKHLSAIEKSLKPGGIFHIGMKLRDDGKHEIRDKMGRMYSYYTQSELTALLVDAGFTTSEITLGKGKGLAGNVEPWIVILSKKT